VLVGGFGENEIAVPGYTGRVSAWKGYMGKKFKGGKSCGEGVAHQSTMSVWISDVEK
jgi:hypothetical protein